ncbi:MAG: hypothetical protein ACI4XL_00055 [Bacillus sp. (in: firmicutes)]
MRGAIKACHEVTEQLHDVAMTAIKDPSGELLEQIQLLLEEREQLLNEIVPPFSPEEQVLGRKIIILNKAIDANLPEIRKQIGRKIQELKHAGQSLPKYSGYGVTPGADAYFYDKKN